MPDSRYGVESKEAGYLWICCTSWAHCLVGQRVASPKRHYVTVSMRSSFFCHLRWWRHSHRRRGGGSCAQRVGHWGRIWCIGGGRCRYDDAHVVVPWRIHMSDTQRRSHQCWAGWLLAGSPGKSTWRTCGGRLLEVPFVGLDWLGSWYCLKKSNAYLLCVWLCLIREPTFFQSPWWASNLNHCHCQIRFGWRIISLILLMLEQRFWRK